MEDITFSAMELCLQQLLQNALDQAGSALAELEPETPHNKDKLARRAVELSWQLMDALEAMIDCHQHADEDGSRPCSFAVVAAVLHGILDLFANVWCEAELSPWPAYARHYAAQDEAHGDEDCAKDWRQRAAELAAEEGETPQGAEGQAGRTEKPPAEPIRRPAPRRWHWEPGE